MSSYDPSSGPVGVSAPLPDSINCPWEDELWAERADEIGLDTMRSELISGLKRKLVAFELGIAMSTLKKWITAHRDTDLVSKEDFGLA